MSDQHLKNCGLSPREYRIISRLIRKTCDAVGTSWPIVVRDGFTSPKVVGQGSYYTNKSGDLVRFPNAYRRKWGKPIYHSSTRQIVVGRGWLLRRELCLCSVYDEVNTFDLADLSKDYEDEVIFTSEGGYRTV